MGEALIRAILWDNDGVLVDTEPLYLRANQEVLGRVGVALSETDYREISLRQGRSVFVLAERHGCSDEHIDALRSERDARYAELLDEGVDVLEGVRETLAALHGRLPMGIVTSSQRGHFERIHAATGLLDYFEFSLASGEYRRHKPHPDPYLAGARRLGLAPAECLAVEDTERGLRAAVAAGMRCLVIPRPLSADGDFSRAHSVLEAAHDLPAEVEPLLSSI